MLGNIPKRQKREDRGQKIEDRIKEVGGSRPPASPLIPLGVYVSLVTMIKQIGLASCLLVWIGIGMSGQAFAHQAFTLVSSAKRTVSAEELAKIEKERTVGKVQGANVTFAEKEIRLVVTTGPEDDMLSFRIQGIRNPTLVVRAGATLKILFVNMDGDMKHDIRLGHVVGEFGPTPDVTATAGADKLASHEEDEAMQAEEMVLKANENGAYKYFCSVRGHAKGGMWGNILVGVKPGANTKLPTKTKHVHSPDEN